MRKEAQPIMVGIYKLLPKELEKNCGMRHEPEELGKNWRMGNEAYETRKKLEH
jgi:hypothetical protein